MATLLNHTHPEMRVYVPQTGQYREFRGGKLEIEKDDPDYEVVMAEASRNPSIVVYESVTTCERCGEDFTGKLAKANLAKHRKEVHPDVVMAEEDAAFLEARNAEIKAREGIPCDLCPHATFPDAEALALHIKVMHTSAPPMDDEGNLKGGGAAAAPEEIPAATPTT
jgi:hypothetical protein